MGQVVLENAKSRPSIASSKQINNSVVYYLTQTTVIPARGASLQQNPFSSYVQIPFELTTIQGQSFYILLKAPQRTFLSLSSKS